MMLVVQYASLVADFLTFVFQILLFCALVSYAAIMGSKSGTGGKGLRIFAYVFSGILLALAIANFGLAVSLVVMIEDGRYERSTSSARNASIITKLSVARVRLNFSLLVLTLAAAVAAAGTCIGLMTKRVVEKWVRIKSLENNNGEKRH